MRRALIEIIQPVPIMGAVVLVVEDQATVTEVLLAYLHKAATRSPLSAQE
jgi:hypothetical protein